jgi:hypothetical protein
MATRKYPLDERLYPLPIQLGDAVREHGSEPLGKVVRIEGADVYVQVWNSETIVRRRKDCVYTCHRKSA